MLATLDSASPSKATATASVNSPELSDDEIAATQQSMLEELHAISEEVLDNKPTGGDASSCDIGTVMQYSFAVKGRSELVDQQILDGRPAKQEGSELPNAGTAIVEGTASALQVDETDVRLEKHPAMLLVTDLVRSGSSSTAMSQTVVVDGEKEESSEAAAASLAEVGTSLSARLSLSSPQHASEHNSATADPELPDAQTICVQADVSLEFDHADLFDGIEADAFDDIELSPPTRRRASLPSIDGIISNGHHSVPPSPTRTRPSMTSNMQADAEFDYDTEDAADKEPEQMPQASQMVSFLDPGFLGFQTGHQKQVKLSEKGLQAARKLMLDLEQTTDLLPPSQASSSAQTRALASTPNAVATGQASNGRDVLPTFERTPLQEILPKQSSTTTNGSERHPFDTKGKQVVSQVVPAVQGATAGQVLQPTFVTPKPMRSTILGSGVGLSSPMRTPVAASGSRFSTPQPSKRISLGVLPRAESSGSSTGKKRSLPKFVTPFKGGKRPRAEDPQDLASPSRSLQRAGDRDAIMASPLPTRQYPTTRKAPAHTLQGPAVFRMQSDGPRHRLADVGRPEYYSAMQMIAKGVPDEIVVILNDATKAAQYAFESSDGTLLTQQVALEELLARGCSAAKLPWVQNHWTLILWKLAALVRLEPSSAPERWSWDELIRQLLYRYEREVHLAQRSCLKRIQEHDSSAARPMVLLVSKIFEEETEVQDRSGAIVPRKSTILELSDGWYRIQAQIDATLTNACQRGRLRIGQKLAVSGATLDAVGDGNEVLAAYHMTSLILAANSVSLARWDAKLGFSATPFCASLRSLTPEGGLVALMDVVLTRVHPLAYMDADRANFNPSAARGEQEEEEAREAWVKKREDAVQQLQLQAESDNGRLYDLVEALSDLLGDSFLPSVPDDPTGQLMAVANQLFDQLRAQPNPASAVNQLVVAAGHTSLVPWLHNLAKSAILTGEGMGGSRLSEDLDKLCPPRKVREFRVVKFRDARLPPPPPAAAQQSNGNGAGPKKKNPYAREVLLTVYDAGKLGDELREGRRFLVTNLMPSERSAWRKADEAADISLCTRRDTKWRPLS